MGINFIGIRFIVGNIDRQTDELWSLIVHKLDIRMGIDENAINS